MGICRRGRAWSNTCREARQHFSSVQFSSVAQSCPNLLDPMNCGMPGLPVHHQLPEFTQTHVHRVSDAIQPSHPLSSPSPPAPNPSQHQILFQWVNSLHEVAKVLEFLSRYFIKSSCIIVRKYRRYNDEWRLTLVLKGKITGENIYVSMHLSDETCDPNGQGYGAWERTEFKFREGYQASLVAQLASPPAMRETWV